MIKKLRLKCHSLTSSNLGYSLPVEVINKESHSGPLSAEPTSRHHSSIETPSRDSNGVILSGESSSQMVGYYHPLAGREEPAEASSKVALRLHGPTRLCYSDDEASMNETPHDLCRSVKSISLNEDSSLCCSARHGDSFSNEEEEETHMSWIEIMAKKRELERSLGSKEGTRDERVDPTSKSRRPKVKRSSFLSPSFKLRDLFSTNPSVERKKSGKSKLHSRTSLVLCTSLSGRGSSVRGSSGSSDDPSPLQFDLRSRGLPAIPVQDADANHHHSDDSADVERTLRGRNSVDRGFKRCFFCFRY